MRCPHCDADTPEGAKFCIECGTPPRPRCPQCGADVLPRAKFCGECGTPLTGLTPVSPPAHSQLPLSYTPTHLAEKILTSRAALEGERKQVTVLFADLKGSMELLADRDPEEARQLLDPVLERMMDAVHRYEGTVNQVMGDGIMALFGAPIAHEDHAVRACYAALAMQTAIRRYSEDLRRAQGFEVQIRVGLHSGEVVVRAIGNDLHMDYTAVGQAYFGLGEFGRAAELLRRNVAALEPDTRGPKPYDGIVSRWPWRLTVSDLSRPEPYDGIVSRAWLALTLSTLGGVAEGRRHGEEALRLAMANSQSDALIIAHGCLGLLSLAKGDLEAASLVLEQGLARCHASGNRDWSISIMGGLGYAYALAGRGEEGLALLKETVREGGYTGERFAYAILLTEFSTVSLLVGHHDEARRHAQHARELARQQKARGDEARALCQLGVVPAYADPPDVERAEASCRQALALAEELGMRPLQAHCHLGLGNLYVKIGHRDEARAELSAAMDLYRAMEMTFWLPQVEAALAQAEGW